MSHPIVVGGTDQSLIMVALDTSDNSFKTDLVAADITSLVVTRTGSTDVPIASPADKSNPDAAHSDGGVFNDGSGQYIVDITDDTVASYYLSLRLQGAWTDSGAGTSGLLIGLVHPMTVNSPNQDIPTAAENRIEMDNNSTQLAAIVADTNELQGLWTTGGNRTVTLSSAASYAMSNSTAIGLIDARIPAALVGGRIDATVDGIGMESGAVTVIQSGLATSAALTTVSDNVDSILSHTGTDGVVVAAASKTGYALSASGVDAILDEAITEPSGMFAWGSATLRNIIGVLGALLRNKVTSDSNSVDVRNDDDDATLWSYATSDDDTTFTSGEGT